ncbi:gamma-glutamyltransferase family protein [Kerstersia similis]|uniref:gamma-glutamyltransferase family protein n=1 Tax=Kerstersia similis TaxID=206505 RepID=UPI0039EEA2A2
MTLPRHSTGVAVAPHALASRSAQSVLRDGGNAIEAMVAAAATIAVVYPHMNGIGGDSFWLLGTPKANSLISHGIDASGAAARAISPASYDGQPRIPFRGGQSAITVAGTISGWEQALAYSRAHWQGTLPLSRLLADAIHYARDGILTTASQYRNTVAKRDELLSVAGFADTFLINGAAPATNSLFRQPRLAFTLERLVADGLDSFYRGDLAQDIASDLAHCGSPLNIADLQTHHVRHVQPLSLHHTLGTLYNMPPPSQGLVSLMILGLMDRLGASHMDPLGADFVHLAVEAAKQAFTIRDAHIGDPRCLRSDPASFLRPAALDAMAARIDMRQAAPWNQGKGPADTVWMGVMDHAGRSVSMIQSIYHEFGSGLVLPTTGINWQNRGASFSLDKHHINALAPGKHPFHTLNPAMARLDDGRTMVYGTMGGDGQPQTQSAVFARTVLHGWTPQAAIDAPRWLLGRTWGQQSDTLKLENRFPAATVQQLAARGHDIEMRDAYDEAFGHAGCLIRQADGRFYGGADPRSDGSVAWV